MASESLDESKKCPACGSIDVRRAGTYLSGVYKCGNCGYIGSLDVEIKKPKKSKAPKKKEGKDGKDKA